MLAALDRLAAEDLSIDVVRLTGSDQLRLRVGDWRVLFRRRPDTRQIVIEHVLPRGRAYDR
jgi:mRNA-degrading endonuclease RelE of RelBE toxin-antitoxin system